MVKTILDYFNAFKNVIEYKKDYVEYLSNYFIFHPRLTIDDKVEYIKYVFSIHNFKTIPCWKIFEINLFHYRAFERFKKELNDEEIIRYNSN